MNASSVKDLPVLKALYFNSMPYFQLSDDGSKMEGIGAVVLQYITNSMNIKYELVRAKDGEILLGDKLSNGSWNGIAGSIHRNETHFSFFPVIHNKNELDTSEVSFPIWFTSYVMLSGASPGIETELLEFLLPFDRETEICMAVSFLLLTFISFIMERSMIKVLPKQHKSFKVSFQKHCTLFVKPSFYQAITNKNVIPRSSPARFCFVMWWMTMVVMINLFSSELTANNSSFYTPFRFDSLQDVIKYPNIRVIAFQDPNLMQYLEKSPMASEQSVYKQIVRTNGFEDKVKEFYSEKNMEETRLGKSLIIADRPSLMEKYKEECLTNDKYFMSKGHFGRILLSLVFAKVLGKPFMNQVNTKIIRFFETGNAMENMAILRARLYSCLGRSAPQKLTDTVFTFQDLRVFLLFYGFLIAASSTVFLLEIFIHYFLSFITRIWKLNNNQVVTKRRKKEYLHFPNKPDGKH